MSPDPQRTPPSADEGCAAETASLGRVQRHGDAIGFTVMSAILAVLVYPVVRIILGAMLWSPAWIALALPPTAAAIVRVL